MCGGAIRVTLYDRGRILTVFLAVVSATAGSCFAASANPRSITIIRDYRVHGNTERSLVNSMKSRPFRGDKGPALANVRPRYRLTTETLKLDRLCRIKTIDLSIRFIMTLPRAVNSDQFNPRTRRAWASFRAFSKRHENVHRGIYMNCARSFLREARRLSVAGSCSALKRRVSRMLRDQKRDCERFNDAFDRRELSRLRALALFRNARLRRRSRPATAVRAPGFGLRHVFTGDNR